MAKTDAAPAVSRERALQSGPAINIEFPREGEVVAPPVYTFQIVAAPGAGEVELSIDQGDWLPCRESLGLWWFDWSDFDKGVYEVIARTRTAEGVYTVSAPRQFRVE